jgi:hypothetical protein
VLELGQSMGLLEVSFKYKEAGHATVGLDCYCCRSHHCISIAFVKGTEEKIAPF